MTTNRTAEPTWDLVIKPKSGWFDLNLGELWRYRDLIVLFIKRDFVTHYKQTVLGPLWYIIQPLFTTLMFTVVFGKLAGISTDGTPQFLFYLAGNVAWRYFADCLTQTSNTFIANAHVFGKVYFPRLTVPISIAISNGVHFLVQFALFLGFYGYFLMTGSAIRPTTALLALPLVLLQMGLLGIGTGILISSLTTKYRDLIFALTFGVQLWMYASPVVYPLSVVPDRFRLLYACNPMVSVLESFRYAFFGTSVVEPIHIAIGWGVTGMLLVGGMVLFKRIEKSFMDTI